jgi:hypothetical protein
MTYVPPCSFRVRAIAGFTDCFPLSLRGQAVLRYFVSLLFSGVLLIGFAGCQSGGEAEFTPTEEGLTEEQKNYAEEYEKQQQENQKRMKEGYN